MKAKILSLLLLVAMLITAVPVMVSAEEAASDVGVSAQSAVDYNDLYVKDGLTALYTTFGDYATTADLSTGKWTDLIGGKTATMGDYGHWRVGEYGGVGFNTFRGNMEDTDSDGYKETFNKDLLTGQNYKNTNLVLSFGISQLPTSDFTVEYLAMYKPVYVYDASEADHIARDKSGNKIEVFQFDNQANGVEVNSSLTGITAGDIDQFGWFTSYATAIDSVGTWGGYNDAQKAARRGMIFWQFNNHTWYAGRNGNSIGANYSNETIMDKANNVFQQNNAVNTYSVSLDETLTVAGDGTRTTTGLFSLYRNGAFFSSNASDLNSTAVGEGKDGGYFDIDKTWTGDQSFRLSMRRPTDFFAVRIYARALSDLEKQQNRGVDVLQWYGIAISAKDAADAVKMQGVYAAIAGFALETDASAKATKKAEIEAVIDGVSLTGAHRTLYVQDGLTSLFTAFAGDATTVKGSGNITWMNRVAGKTSATFVGSHWAIGANGGIGRDVIYGTLHTADDGTLSFAGHNDRNTYWATTDHKLQLGLELLPKDDYTLEYVAYYPPQYSVDAKTGQLVATSELETLLGATAGGQFGDGKIEMYPYQITWVDRIGFLAFITDNPAGHIETQPAGTLRPRAEDSGCKQWGGTAGNGGDVYGWGDIKFSVDNRNIGRVATYALTRDEATTYDENGVATLQTAVYSQLQDGAVLKSKTFTTADGKIAMGGKNTGSQYFFGDDDTDFYLSYRIGAYYYALRVYDRVLTADERAKNNAADVYYYYGLSLSDEALANAEVLAELVKISKGVVFERDAAAYAATRDSLQAAVDAIASTLLKKAELMTMYAAADNLVGLFSVYAKSTVNLEKGTWRNLVGDTAATIGDASRWSFNANGSFGYNAWVGKIADDGTKTNVIKGSDESYLGFDGTNHARQRAARINFGLALLPAGDMTLEYVAMSKTVYVADAEESSADKVVYAKDASGNYLSAYSVFGKDYFNALDYGTPSNICFEQVGYYGTISPVTDGEYWGGGRGAIHWMLETSWSSDRTGVGSGGAWGGSWGLNVNGNPFWTTDVIHTYGISIDETEKASATEAIFSLYRNATHYNSNADKVSTTANGTYYAGGYAANASKAGFYLSAGRPTDFYTIRIYDRLLTDAEKARNYMVDLILYYDVKVSMELFADDALVQKLAALFAGIGFEQDATKYAAVRAAMLERVSIDGSLIAKEMLDLYAKSEHITALFTVYEPDTINLTAGTWTDLIGGKKATFGEKSIWKMGANGGVGFNIFHGTMTAEGKFTDAGYSTANNAKAKLAFDVQWLSTEDFTVEYNVFYKPIYVYDVNQEDCIARDAAGNLLETFVLKGNTPDGAATKGIAIDRFGWFSSWSNNIAGNYSGLGRGGLVWLWHAPAWGGNNSKWVGDNWNGNSENTMTPSWDPFTQDNKVGTYGFMVDETRDGDVVTALVGLHRNGVKYRDNAAALQSTANGNGSVDGGYLDREFQSDEYFYLSTARPTDFFTVRVYDIALDANDRLQNYFIDMLYYYGVDIPAELAGKTEVLLALATELTGLGMATGASAKAANKSAIQAAIKAQTKTVTVQVGSAVLGTLEVFGDMLTLPTLVDNGKFVIGWRVEGVEGNVAPGTSVTVTGDVTATPTVLTLPATDKTQSIKVTETAEEMGVRFTATLSRAEYMMLIELYGSDNIKLGMLITPDAYVQKAGGVFTREALRAMVDASKSTSGAAYVEVAADGFYRVEENILTVAGSIYNFKAKTFARDPEFAAVAFIDVDTDADGMTDFTVYGSYDQKASVSVKDAMTGARENLTNTQKEWIDSLLSKFGA